MTNVDEIIATFELLGEWETRYQYLIDLGERLEPLPENAKTEETWVKPCMSTVHVQAIQDNEDPARIRYRGDCDTAIIKGVLALLVKVMSHRTPDEIRTMDIDALFSGLRLEEHLSPNRHVGIYAIVDKMKEQADQFGLR